MRPHQKLDLWKKAIEFVIAIYKLTERFPKEEKFGLTSQMSRASVSIAANISEGAALTSVKEFMQFLSGLTRFGERSGHGTDNRNQAWLCA